METPLGRVRGLGSAGAGAEHWWHERLSSIGAFLLFAWFVASLLRLPDFTHETIAEWLRQPLAAVPMLLLIVVTFWHLKMGLQVIVEDYVHEEGNKLFCIVLINFASVFGAALALFSVLKIAFAAVAAAPPPAGP
ncbi:MAG TPA: succinate dehydrogenase, hydrophobic membrane anchor protein [Allosphingosinicella sp.]|jgi:succinate dehydrogenase / fumarate reductase membrane anchor subunit